MLELGNKVREPEIAIDVEDVADMTELAALDVIGRLLAGDVGADWIEVGDALLVVEDTIGLAALELLVVDRVELEPGSDIRAAPQTIEL